jgi:two-component system, chemotaxis family, chemotaxis protein CheY
MRVLIVDDSPVVRRLVERVLRETGISIEEVLDAGNGLDALKVLRRCDREDVKLDLILCDICMPGMDGLEFLEKRQADRLMPEIPAVMITADASLMDVRRAMAAGAVGYIRKPFVADQVKAVVLRLVHAA